MRHTRPHAVLSVAFFVALLSGCVGFRGPELAATPWPLAGEAAPRSIGVEITGLRGELLSNFQQQTLKAYRDSQLFSDVRAGRVPGGLTARISVAHHGAVTPFMAILTGLTLYLIPSSASDEFAATTTFEDASGSVIAKTQETQKVTLWQQLFLVFLMPTNAIGGETKQLYYDLARASLIAASKSGL